MDTLLSADSVDELFQAPQNFLALPDEYSRRDTSRVWLLPVPYEATTSYRGGAKHGPAAIIDASAQVELFDREFENEPALIWGVHTLPALAPDRGSVAATIDRITHAVKNLADPSRLLGVLGGEHAISVGVTRGLHAVFGEFTVVQLDAHADLRDTYEGTDYSHACAARRMLELAPVVQFGIRSVDISEYEFIRAESERLQTFFAEDVRADLDGCLAKCARRLEGRKVFLSIDVDVFDSAVMPSTGTPEPGGLAWDQVLSIVRWLGQHCEVIGFDCMELAPTPGLHAPDYLTAKLVYKTISLLLNHSTRFARLQGG